MKLSEDELDVLLESVRVRLEVQKHSSDAESALQALHVRLFRKLQQKRLKRIDKEKRKR